MTSFAPVTLQGAHVRLEPLTLAHVDALVAATNEDPAEQFPFTWVYRTNEAARAWVEEALAAQAQSKALPFATIDAKSGAVVGSTRFGNIEFWDWRGALPPRPPESEGEPDAVEIGWTWLARGAQRTAINTEAKLLMLTHAFEAWHVYRVTLKTDARNQRSRNAIARIGGTFDGVLRAHMPAADGGIRDTAFFSLLAAEWPAAKAKLLVRLARGGAQAK